MARQAWPARQSHRKSRRMILASIIALIALAVVIVVVATVQQLYLESQRLRARELPMQQFFRAALEARLGLNIDNGSLAFSLVKHSALLLVGVFSLAAAIDGGRLGVWAMAQAAFVAWLFMMAFAYVLPHLLYRRSNG